MVIPNMCISKLLVPKVVYYLLSTLRNVMICLLYILAVFITIAKYPIQASFKIEVYFASWFCRHKGWEFI